jgi:hypothetical protein
MPDERRLSPAIVFDERPVYLTSGRDSRLRPSHRVLVRKDGPNILLLGGGCNLGQALSLEPAQLSRDCGVIIDDQLTSNA